MFRANSKLIRVIGTAGSEFVDYAASAIQRILPHVEISAWDQVTWTATESVWVDATRRKIRVTIAIGDHGQPDSGALSATITRKGVSVAGQVAGQTLDTREYDICKIVINQIEEILKIELASINPRVLAALKRTFDEEVIARHIQAHHGITMEVSGLFGKLHELSEQTYENKSFAFGCLIDPSKKGAGTSSAKFPTEFLETKKKYRALSDGFRTAYLVSGDGHVLDFLDLQNFHSSPLTAHNYYPDWGELLSQASRGARCGVALTRQGDILVFDGGTLRFTHRHGRWQYWNHAHIVNLLCDRAKAQRVPPATMNRVIASAYVAALDISFRRSGGLIVILHNLRNIRNIVRLGDAVADPKSVAADLDFDKLLSGKKIQSVPTRIIVELASLDGAVVVSNLGEILAYGAILDPKRSGKVRASEGSRTKAATGASNYGLAFKVSSDGGIQIFYKGSLFIEVSKT